MGIHVTVIGSGMIMNDQILPSLYHLQREEVISDVWVCATSTTRLRALAEAQQLQEAFPGHGFKAFPDLSEDPKKRFPTLYKDVIANTPADSIVLIATPEQMHYEIALEAIKHKQHVVCVKPLVLEHEQAMELGRLAHEQGVFVGVEYHKRFDRRNLEARLQYRRGRFGEFRSGEAKLIEPWYYRDSNFQNWFTKDQTDPFTYVGCHYVDAVYFITGLRPVEVSVRGVEGKFPNGNEAYMWSSGRVVFENGGVLSVTNGLGYPDTAAGGNHQGMCLFCEGADGGATIDHNDQFRGVSHGYLDAAPGQGAFRFINPDYFRLIPWTGKGLKPVGYGYESIEALVHGAKDLVNQTAALSKENKLKTRREILTAIDEQGILATPNNSAINELVIEAARMSIVRGGANVGISYDGKPSVKLLS